MFMMWLAIMAACDDTTFNSSHAEAVDGVGIDGVTEVFDGNCVGCHAGEAASASLALDGDRVCFTNKSSIFMNTTFVYLREFVHELT